MRDLIIDNICFEGRKLTIVRDDIYPVIGGGNKARKSVYYEKAMRDGGYNACVTTGGIQSNHNRAIALMCAKNGWRCHNVYHGSKERFYNEKGNALLVRKSGATFEFVDPDRIGPAMDDAMERFRNQGFKPMYIHGGGHDLPGGMAFVDAVRELKSECGKSGYKPSHVFLASGTGSTQAGIAVGLDMVGWSDIKLTGVSVARQKARGTQVVVDFANMLSKHLDQDKDYTGSIDFNTDYLFGGYEMFSPEMAEYLDGVMRTTGIMFDTTYSGKAFYGMMDYIKKNDIHGNILFWHTGGLM
ncbi:MAG: pyridoxal-phosphate dependent enzyme, partial [Muribaculaceae bacterium]|nr:pyridoxal-phosphate dependent enzyme [Muribaculaceae bacterium]